MKLIGSLTSPYVRKVRVVLAEKKIECEFVLDPPWAAETGVPQLNPLGKVPVLVLDDSSTLFDSRVIAEYLDHAAPNNRLIPSSNRERAQVKRWEALSDGICDAAALVFLERKRQEDKRSGSWIERQQDKILRGVEWLSRELGEQPWFHGTSVSLADIATGCALGYLSFRFPEIEWRKTHPNLGKLYDKLMNRPSFAETVPRD
jgi:glutathione S-transferase